MTNKNIGINHSFGCHVYTNGAILQDENQEPAAKIACILKNHAYFIKGSPLFIGWEIATQSSNFVNSWLAAPTKNLQG